MFCDTCRGVICDLRGIVTRDRDEACLLHHTSTRDLIDAAEACCVVCRPFWDHLREEQKEFLRAHSQSSCPTAPLPPIEDDSETAWKIRGEALERCCTLAIILPASSQQVQQLGPGSFMLSLTLTGSMRAPGVNPSGKAFMSHVAVVHPMTDVDRAEIAANTALAQSTTTASHASWDFARRCVDTCLSTHIRCNLDQDDGWRPTRLLDLQSVGEDTFRVVDSAEERITDRYMTLSHRWGTHKPLTLLHSTKARLREGMLLSELPQSFQDAAAVCRRFGVRYLWIDSLCIMQDLDDRSDWEREATLMHKVYSRSFLNISTLAAPDSGHSMYATRDPRNLQQEGAICSRINFATDSIGLVTEAQDFRVVHSTFWQNEVNSAPLNLRGWVLQERILSPRVLHFGHQQLFFECHMAEAAESFPNGLPAAANLANVARFKDWADTLPSADQATFAAAWTRMIRAYGQCGLTHSADKLVALAGVAQAMAIVRRDEYVVGMWRSTLAVDLCWSVDVDDSEDDNLAAVPRRRRPISYRAPSWSWINVDVPVLPRNKHGTMLAAVLDVSLDIAHRFAGPVRRGSIVLRGQLQKIHLSPMPELSSHWVTSINGHPLDKIEGATVWDRMGPVIMLDEHRSYDKPMDRDDLYCMPLTLSEDNHHLWVLLFSLTDAETGCFRRLGFMAVIKPAQQQIVMLPHPQGKDYPCREFSNGQHVIEVI